jgi:acyl dehydratase
MSVSIPAVYEKVKAAIGKTERVKLGAVRERDFQRFAIAAGNLNPLYFDNAAAKAAGYPSTIAPQLYLSSVMGWEVGPPEDQLRADGTGGQEAVGLPVDGVRLMGGGQDLEFHHPVTDSMEVTMEVGPESVELKEGRSGQFLVITLTRRYRDQNDRLLVTCRENFIAR